MRAVVETPSFLRDARNAGLTEEERAAVVWYLAIHPNAGDEIRGTGGARKSGSRAGAKARAAATG